MRRIEGLKRVAAPATLKILFLAPYAPDSPDFLAKPYHDDGGYPEYHYKLYTALKSIGFQVWSSSKPYAVHFARGNVDYVFSLMNRMPILNAEVFVSAYCEFLRISYLGARPNIRALAEDKYLTKLAAQSIGIPVSPGLPISRTQVPSDPPFDGPYFVKDRFGAASEGISERNLCPDWSTVLARAEELHGQYTDLLVERFCPGIDVTVPVLGGAEPLLLGFVQPKSDKVGQILTEDLKLFDHLGYQSIDVGPMEAAFTDDIDAIWRAFGPMDYFRADYRVDLGSGRRWLLEINICCYIGKSGAICLAGRQHGLSQNDILEHVIAYSLERQQLLRQHSEWIL